MDDAWARINRAKTGVERLHETITTWAIEHPDAYGVATEHDGEGHVCLRARVRETPPSDWGLPIGDILVDLRSALDYAVYALARSHTRKDPPPFPERLEFPISRTPKWFSERGLKKLVRLPQGAIDYIESVQPYQPGYGGPDSALLILNELVGINKHRFVLIVWSVLKETAMGFKIDGATVEDFTAFKIDGPLKDGEVLAEFRLVAAKMQAKLELQTSITAHVAFEPTSPAFGSEVYDTLCILGGAVEDVVTHLQTHL